MCRDRTTGSFGYITHADQSGPTVVCDRVDDIANLAKLSYYAARLIVLLGG